MGDIRTSQFGGIPFGNSANRPANSLGQPYFNGEEKRLELYTAAGWANIVQQAPTITGVSGQYLETNASNTVQIIGTNFAEGAIAYATGTNGAEISATTTTFVNSVQVNATFSGLSGANEPYNIKVLNPSNLFGILANALYINQTPAWNTISGSLGSFDLSTSVNTSVLAIDPENQPLTYSISGGALPSGLSLNSVTGVITGTAPAVTTTTTYSFSVNVSDGNNSSTRAFSITINGPTVSGGILASDSTYYYRVFKTSGNFALNFSTTVDVLAIAGGGGGGAQAGGGAGGLIVSDAKSITAATYPIVVGTGGLATASGLNTTAFGHTANGGGRGGMSNDTAGGSGGSGGGSGRDYGTAGSATQGSGVGFIGYGFNGGNASQTGHGGAGGGGGAGGAGANGTGNGSQSAEGGGAGGAGHNGKSSWLSAIASVMPSDWQTATASGRIAGGGGTAGNSGSAASASSGAGGAGGGGRGFHPSVGGVYGDPGINHTGSGGGSNRNGGDGIVVIRYLRTAVGG